MKQLKVRLLAIVRRCCHQQEMAREVGQHLAQVVALRIAHFSSENKSPDIFVSFIAYD